MSAETHGRELADKARQDFELGMAPISDLAELLESTVGVDVAFLRMPEGHDGLTRKNPLSGDIVVAVATSDLPERQRFTLAHELGHILADDLHDTLETIHQQSSAETRAHAFARNFLAPLNGVKRLAERKKELDLVSEVIRHFGVSPRVALIQLKAAGLDRATLDKAQSYSAAWFATRYGWDAERSVDVALSQKIRPPRSIVAAATSAYEAAEIDAVMLARVRKDDLVKVETILHEAGIQAQDPSPRDRAFELGDEDW